jgi:hypothetical protein
LVWVVGLMSTVSCQPTLDYIFQHGIFLPIRQYLNPSIALYITFVGTSTFNTGLQVCLHLLCFSLLNVCLRVRVQINNFAQSRACIMNMYGIASFMISGMKMGNVAIETDCHATIIVLDAYHCFSAMSVSLCYWNVRWENYHYFSGSPNICQHLSLPTFSCFCTYRSAIGRWCVVGTLGFAVALDLPGH